MKQPHYITSHRLIDILEQQYGLYHRVNRSHVWDLTDLLKQQYDVNILYRIYEEGPISDASLYDPPYISITGAKVNQSTHDNTSIQIPEENFHGCRSWYITDTAQWILWIQSAQDAGKVWAWLIDLTGMGRITALNDDIRSGGWCIRPTETLRRHIREWEAVCEQAHQAHESWQRARQHPTTPDCAFELQLLPDAMPVMQATQRIPRFEAQWPVQDPALDELQVELLNKIRAGMQPFQTKLTTCIVTDKCF